MSSLTPPSLTMVHEAVDERQHIRITFPTRAILSKDGKEFKAELTDLSVGGVAFKVAGHDVSWPVGTLIQIEVLVDLEVVELSFQSEIRIVSRRGSLFGAEFTDMDLRTRDVLRYLISSCLGGDLASVNGVFTVIQRENQIKQRKVSEKSVRTRRDRAKAIVGTLLYFAVAIVVATLVINQLYNYIFRLEALQAQVSGNSYIVSMPDNGYVSFLTSPDQTEIKTGEPLASVSSQLATRFNTASDLQALQELGQSDLQALMNKAFIETLISSPCDCELYFPASVTDRYAYKLDELVHLLPKAQPLFVEATFGFEKMKDLGQIDRVEMRVLGSSETVSGTVKKALVDSAEGTVKLTIETEQPLAMEHYLKPVQVEVFKPLPGADLFAAIRDYAN